MTADLSEFRPYLAGLDMSEAEENEFMTFVWNMMKGFVDRAWGCDPTQLCVKENNAGLFPAKDSQAREDRVKSKKSLTDQFVSSARYKEA